MSKLKRLNYNKDYMSDKMDTYMEQIEDRLSALYANAAYDVNQKFAEFAKGFEKQDANMLAQVEAGKISQEEYTQWRSRKMLQDSMYRSTVDEMSTMLVNTDVAAMALVNNAMPSVVAQSYNFTQALGFEAAKKAGMTQGTFQVYNARSVQKIVKDNPKLLKEVDRETDSAWNRDKINKEITAGIVQGEPIPKISDRLQRVANMDNNAATRNARTAMTAAENIGRSEAADELKEQGIPMEEVWSATYDDRTRETHLMLDGTVRDENGYFGADFLVHPLRFPADPDGDPEEIYNCRCRMSLQLKGIDHSNDKELYEQFMKENFPETWKSLQENEGYQAKQEQEKKALERKERLLASKEEKLIPPPEKISLTSSNQEVYTTSTQPKEDTKMTQTTDKFVYERSEDIKEWSKAEEKRTRETSDYIDKMHKAGGGWDEFYEENGVGNVESFKFADARGKEHEITITKMNFTYVSNWDENDRRVKAGKAVTGSTFYTVDDNEEYISDNDLGYKTLADARHAAQLYADWEKQRVAYWAGKERG